MEWGRGVPVLSIIGWHIRQGGGVEWGRGVPVLSSIGWHIRQGGRGGVGAGCSGVVQHWVAHKTRGAGWSGGGVFRCCPALGGT